MGLHNEILVCTVGGSHQPILTAIREVKPDFIVFLCSGRDPGTGKPGSVEQIKGKGKVIKANPYDEKPTLANIPTQAELPEGSYEVVEIPADDLDRAFMVIRKTLADLVDRYPRARIVADFTGGTKSMTAALVIAALNTDSVELQIVTGNRADLIKVTNGTEASAPVNIESIRLNRSMAPYLSAWKRHAYDEAADGLSRITRPANPVLRNRLNRARDISKAFAAWDRFDHSEAERLLKIYESIAGKELGEYFAALRLLVKESEQQEPARILDLWRNAERRAVQGRHDDAVARCYRMIEWTAQWLLRTKCDIDTSNISREQLPDGFEVRPDRDNRIKAGLCNAWDLLRHKLPDSPAGRFAEERLSGLLELIRIRNNSILAHGKDPVGQENWDRFHSWLEENFLPMLREEMKQVRIHKLPPQLPDCYRWEEDDCC